METLKLPKTNSPNFLISRKSETQLPQNFLYQSLMASNLFNCISQCDKDETYETLMGRKLAAGTSGERAANATNPRRWWRAMGMGGEGEVDT